MQFTSFGFLGFFACVFGVCWTMPARARWAAALAASAAFAALCGLPTLGVLVLVTAVSYAGGLFLASRRGRRGALAASVAATLTPLLFFKYFDVLFGAFAPAPLCTFSRLAPIGVSFFTFKAVAYLAEVYKGTISAQKHLGHYALYISFFPEMSMGPIQRPGSLLGQINAPRAFDTGRALGGARLMLWGFFEKLVVADNLPYHISLGMDTPDAVIGASVLLASLLYAVQLYADFAGYTHIAVGCMNLLGFESPDNFRSPYFSLSVREFWERWHISLSSWLRDYIYIPLGGSRCGTVRCCIHLMLTFFVSGLWHGTGTQFVVWGLLHGLYAVFGRLSAPVRARLWRAAHISEMGIFARAVKTLVTFALVWAGWVFFRAPGAVEALHLFARMAGDFPRSPAALKNGLAMLGFTRGLLVRVVLACILFFGVDFAARHVGTAAWLSARKPWQRWALCYAAVLFLLFAAPYASSGAPIYFQF